MKEYWRSGCAKEESQAMPARSRCPFAVLVCLCLCSLAPLTALSAAESSGAHTQWVNPFVGADGGGNTVPGAAVPFGFVELSPDTTNADTNGYSSGGQVIGFSHTHVSGTGGDGKYGNFRVTPTSGMLRVGNLRFSKAEESASPGYYTVTLAGDGGRIRCELTATRLVGVERFTFPGGADGNIILDASSRVKLAQRATHVEVTVVDDMHILGSASFTGGWNPNPYTLYFWAAFSHPMKRWGVWTADLGNTRIIPEQRHIVADQTHNYANQIGAFAVFDTTKHRVVEMKLAVSFLSPEKARSNLEQEAAAYDFDGVRRQAEDAWKQVLARIEVAGGTESQRRTFYTALYRSHYMPHDLTGENVWWQSSEPHYEDFYTLWDTFRTLHPLLTLIQPERQRDMVRSLVDTYRHTGWLPDARIAGSNGLTQGGSNGDVVVADAIVKGLEGIDYETAYQALAKDAEVESPRPLNEGRQLEDYKRLGYMSLTYSRSASRTLEYAYDDFAISEVARALGKTEDSKKYLERSGNWARLWDSETRCIRPRYSDGRWLENYDCEHEYPDATTEWWDAPFYEGSPIQYSPFVPHDVNGLIQRLGGEEAFTTWLDALFDRQLYTQGNEPDLLAPWLYIHCGRPDRTADRVRALLASEYREGRDGLPGNDDAGTMSSWYVWSAIGIFPNAGQPFYYIGSPVFTRITIDLGAGRRFMVEARGTSAANRYVQRAELDGRRLDRAWLTHGEIAAGGRLVLYMGSRPSRWGSDERPPSASLSADARYRKSSSR
jgi:predicted alpha-1,2-mannosidase